MRRKLVVFVELLIFSVIFLVSIHAQEMKAVPPGITREPEENQSKTLEKIYKEQREYEEERRKKQRIAEQERRRAEQRRAAERARKEREEQNKNKKPTITGLSPTHGPVGTVVRIKGTNFSRAARVTFSNGVNVIFTINSEGTEITATVPDGATAGPISVTTPTGVAISKNRFNVTP